MSQPVSSRWYPALQSSHLVATRFNILQGGTGALLYQSPVTVSGTTTLPTIVDSTEGPNCLITGGNVTLQKGVDQRSRFTMTLLDPTGDLINSGILTPWGNEMAIYSGLLYSDGTSELLPLGVFRITDVDGDDEGKGVVITVQGQDRSRIIARDQVTQFYQTASNQAYTDAMRAMILSAYPYATFDQASWSNVPPNGINVGGSSPNMIFTPTVYGITFQQGDDLWDEARQMSAALACDLYFDRLGVCTLKEDPNLNYMNAAVPSLGSIVYQFVEGETATFNKVSLKQSDQNAYNQWVITGEGQVIGYTQAPLQNFPFPVDNDPNSPTYIYGPYGAVTGFATNQYMVSQPQINLYGQFMLATSIGKQQTMVLSAFTDPSLDLDDAITITRADLGIVNQGAIISQLQIPFTAKEVMTVTTREQRAITFPLITA